MTEPIEYTRGHLYEKSLFGFWLYLLTDAILFAVFFATYWVLHPNTFGGPSARQILHLSHALGETILLLTASLFAGLARVQALRNEKNHVVGLYFLTFVAGAWFFWMALDESMALAAQGYSWKISGFLSVFYTVIWAHGAHIFFGLIWLIVMGCQIFRQGINEFTFRRLTFLTMFWQFLAVIWIFTFTIVYLMGEAGL